MSRSRGAQRGHMVVLEGSYPTSYIKITPLICTCKSFHVEITIIAHFGSLRQPNALPKEVSLARSEPKCPSLI